MMKNNNTGVTLMELLVALAIMSAGLLPIMQLFPLSIRLNYNAQNVYKATVVARTVMNRLLMPSIVDDDFSNLVDTDFDALTDDIGSVVDLMDTEFSNIKWYAEVDNIPDNSNLIRITLHVFYPSRTNPIGNSITLVSYRVNIH